MSINLAKDIAPLSDFRKKIGDYIRQIKNSRRPLVLTQHGRSSVIVEDIYTYQNRLDELDVYKQVVIGIEAIKNGDWVSHEDARKMILEKINEEI